MIDRLDQAVLEQVDLAVDLVRLVAGPLHLQVVGQDPLERREGPVNVPAEVGDLRPLDVADRQGDGAGGPELGPVRRGRRSRGPWHWHWHRPDFAFCFRLGFRTGRIEGGRRVERVALTVRKFKVRAGSS